MGQSVTLNPNLTVLMPLFRERCACIRKMVRNCRETVSAELIQQLRSSVLAPLTKPTKAEVQEELELIASLSVTIDLIAQGWRIITISPAVVIEFANCFSPEVEKERIRHVHLIDRDDQLRQPATRVFIKGMEKKRLTKKGWHSIYSVMRDGESLARDLSAVRTTPDLESKLEQLRGAIKPYIQFVERDAYCEHTGLRLMDIWRYFRHTWVNSYKSVPGRSMMILIRDAAVENHPVVGIACLASSVVQQSSRDKWIGWDSESAIEHFRSSTNPKRDAAWLIGEIDRFIKSIYLKDLLDSGLITRPDLRKPTSQIIEKLLKDSERAIKHHRRYPNAAQHKHVTAGTVAEWRARAQTSLFRSERSKQLACLLSVRVAFHEQKIGSDVTKAAWAQAFENARFRQAVGQIVRMLKGERVGVNMMDITVCGAVAPYNLLLGGKLVCLLLCSPEVINGYQHRYENQTSLIASSMRGAPVPVKGGGLKEGIEVFPRQDKLDHGEYGNAIRAPLGVHRKTNRRYWFYEAEATPEGQLAYLERLTKLSEAELRTFIEGMSLPEAYRPVATIPYAPPPSSPRYPEFRILDYVRTTRKDSRNWWARCPSCAASGHDRSGDNLAIQVKDPRFYKCWAGCTKEEIRAALGQPVRKRAMV